MADEAWKCDDCSFETTTEETATVHAWTNDHWLFSTAGRSMHASDAGGVYVDDAATTQQMRVRPTRWWDPVFCPRHGCASPCERYGYGCP